MNEQNKQLIMRYTAELIRAQFDNREPSPVPEQVSLEELIKIASEGHMEYLFYTALIKVCKEQKYVEFFRQAVYRSTMRTLAQVCEMNKITEKFEAEGIKHQVLKGGIMKKEYPRSEMREMSDLDIMIYGNSLDAAEMSLQEIGHTTYALEKHHLVMFKRPFVCTELHWTLYDENVDKAQFEYFKSDFLATVKAGTQYTYEFSLENFYVYMIAHMAKHFYENGCGIRNLLDIYVYLENHGSELNQKKLEEGLSACGLLDFEKHMRELAYIWMEQRECSKLYSNLFHYMCDCGIYGKSENGSWAKIAQDCEDGNNLRKLRCAFYFPSVNSMEEKYPWVGKYPVLLPIAWGMRAFRGLSNEESRKRKDKIESADMKQANEMYEIYSSLNLKFK